MAQTDALNNIQDTAVGYEFTGQETESLSWTNRAESNGNRVEHGFSSFPLFDFVMMQNSTLQVDSLVLFSQPRLFDFVMMQNSTLQED